MKIATFQIDNYTIEVHNSLWTGIERVYVNGRRVSKAFNWFHGVHRFELPGADGYGTDHYRVDLIVNWSKMSMVDVDLYRNGICLVDQSGQGGLDRVIHVASTAGTGYAYGDDRLELRELNRVPLYREEDLV